MVKNSVAARHIQLLMNLDYVFWPASYSVILQNEEVCIVFVFHRENLVTNPLTFNKLFNPFYCIFYGSFDHFDCLSYSFYRKKLISLRFLFFFSFKLIKGILAWRLFLLVFREDDALVFHHVSNSLNSFSWSPPYRSECSLVYQRAYVCYFLLFYFFVFMPTIRDPIFRIYDRELWKRASA